MRKPEESLEEFTVKAMAIEEAAEPAPVVSLRFRGGVEVLKPLASREGLADPDPARGNTFFRPAPYRFSWLQGFLGAAGALAMMALVFLSAIFVGIYDPPPGPSVGSVDPSDSAIDRPEDRPTRTERPLKPDIFAVQNPSPEGDALRPVHTITKPRPKGPRVQLATYRPRLQSRRQRPVVTPFVPTTLVISAENGEVKTRVEPRLAAAYKKPLTVTN